MTYQLHLIGKTGWELISPDGMIISGSGLPPQGFKDGDEVVLGKDFKFQFRVTNFKGVAYSNTSNNQSTKVVALSLTKTEVKEGCKILPKDTCPHHDDDVSFEPGYYSCQRCGTDFKDNPNPTPPSREEEQGEKEQYEMWREVLNWDAMVSLSASETKRLQRLMKRFTITRKPNT